MQQDNSLNMTLEQLTSLQREQLMEIRALRQDTRMSNINTPFGTNADNRGVKFTPYTLYSMENNAPVGFSDSTNQMFQNASAYYNQSAHSFKNDLFMDPMRVTKQNQEFIARQHVNKLQNAGLALAGGVAGVAGDLLGGAMFSGFLPSVLGGFGAGAAASWLFNTGLEQTKQHQSIDNFLFQNSYKFINRHESNDTRYGSGFNMRERHEAADFIRHLNTDKLLKDSEIQSMMQQFTDYGLMKSVTDLESFKKRMDKLVDVTKASALALNETYDNVTKLMGDLHKMGIDSKNFDYTSSTSKVLGMYMGKDASQVMMDTAQLAGSMVSGTSVSADTQFQNVALMQKAVSRIKDVASEGRNNLNLSESDRRYYEGQYSYIVNNGDITGVSGQISSKIINSATSNELLKYSFASLFDYDDRGNLFIKDQSELNKTISALTSGDPGAIYRLMDTTRSKAQNNKDFAAAINTRLGSGIMSNLNQEQQVEVFDGIVKAVMAAQGMSSSEAHTWLGTGFGGDDRDILNALVEMFKGKDYTMEFESEKIHEQILNSVRAGEASIPTRIKNAIGKLGDRVGDAFVAPVKGFDPTITRISDWWNGTQFSNYEWQSTYDYSRSGRTTYSDDLRNILTEGVVRGSTLLSGEIKDLDKITFGSHGHSVTYGVDEFYGSILGKHLSGEDVHEAGLLRYNNLHKDLSSRLDSINERRKILDNHVKKRRGDYKKIFGADLYDKFDIAYSTGEGVNDLVDELSKMKSGANSSTAEYIDKMINDLTLGSELALSFDSLGDARFALEDLRDRTVQSGQSSLFVAGIFGEDVDGYNKHKKSLNKMISKTKSSVKQMTLQEMIGEEQKYKDATMEYLSNMPTRKINEALANNEYLKQYLEINSDGNARWNKNELEQLVDKLMVFAQAGKQKDDMTQGTLDNRVGEITNSHEETLKVVLDTFEKEIKDMQDFVYKRGGGFGGYQYNLFSFGNLKG